MDDLISKQAAIDFFKKYQPYLAVRVIEFGDALEQLPSAQPEQKTGVWIKEDRGGVEYTAVCSECGYATF